MDDIDTADRLVGRRVRVELTEGTAVRGVLAAVTAERVELDRDDGGTVGVFARAAVVGVAVLDGRGPV